MSKNLAVVNNHALSPTSAHELGHCLNLWHTHHGLGCGDTGGCAESINGSNCSTCGDFVCDTPADPCVLGQYNLNCQYTGGGGYNPDVTNIMSYGGLCRNHFTMGQATRMKNSIQGSSLLQQVIGNSCLIPKLTGSDTVCYSNTVYSLQNGGSNVTWQVSSNLQIVSSSNTSITVKAMSSLTQGSGYIKAILQYQNLQKDVWVGKFLPLDLRLRDPSTNNPVYFICYLQSTTVKATHDSGTVPDSWQWSVSGASVTYPYSSNNSLATLHPYSYNITVKIKAHNDCGWSDWADVTPDVIPCGMYFTVSPNPAQSEITITPAESTTDEANISNTNDTQNRIPVDIELYDIIGIKVKQTAFNMRDPMTMDVSRLRNGIYFLKIIVGDYIETHQLVIH